MEVIQIEKAQFEDLMQKVNDMHTYLLDKPILRESIELLSVVETADALNISESTVYRAIKKGIITKNEDGKLNPLDINEALLKKKIKCDIRFAEEFRRTYIYK
ncbi:MAG: hypothetical protein SNJ29_13255 [Rikenellaceae bacterium]